MIPALDLVEADDRITHELSLDEDFDLEVCSQSELALAHTTALPKMPTPARRACSRSSTTSASMQTTKRTSSDSSA